MYTCIYIDWSGIYEYIMPKFSGFIYFKKNEIVTNCIDNVFDMLDCFAYQSITKDTRVLENKLI